MGCGDAKAGYWFNIYKITYIERRQEGNKNDNGCMQRSSYNTRIYIYDNMQARDIYIAAQHLNPNLRLYCSTLLSLDHSRGLFKLTTLLRYACPCAETLGCIDCYWGRI